MFRKKRRFPSKVIFFIIACSFIIVGFFAGYYKFTPPQDEKIPFAEENNIQRNERIDNVQQLEESDDAPVNYHEDSIEAETQIVYKTFYTICENTMEEVMTPVSAMVGLNETGFQEYVQNHYPLFEIEKFSSEEVVLFQRKEAVCPNHYNHYLITVNEGYITIYQINENGEKILVEKTAVSAAMLPHVDQEKLKSGILRKTKEEVYQLLEDYSS
ncbi:BofC C-terminal domain-containing protein [Clostridium formicaceticum]|uniref:Bypass of forespore C C-terminal domain-containing protein n=1 Tax=Clostridium formicaceticum TaxID=1497 RepID=A0AAC9RLA8_9CLOT|nr:BofC C-terminal domain-containing protein [Clostridium formicaceticum]AOY76934.1 hypothetical protein BJL90_14355 [Clostridium formicaceticum]ARE87415.1 hypothetical protein CLFO_18150 [Clostridium formicaceticum]